MENLLKRFAPEIMFAILAANVLVALVSRLAGYAQIPFDTTLSQSNKHLAGRNNSGYLLCFTKSLR